MATSSQTADLSDEGPPYRSFKDLRGDPTVAVALSSAAKRLFWPLDGVFPSALSVMKTHRNADDLEPYFQQTLEGGIWHEIAQQPLTEPKVSSVEASIYDLEQWEFNWVAWHGHHEGQPAKPEYITYGDLSDEVRPYATEPKEDGSWEEDSDTEFLVRCCGQDRPLRKRGQKLLVSPAAGGHFVTVHDYVSGESSFDESRLGCNHILANDGERQLCIHGSWTYVLRCCLPRRFHSLNRILGRRKCRGWWTMDRSTKWRRSRVGFKHTGVARRVLSLPQRPRFSQGYVRVEIGDFEIFLSGFLSLYSISERTMLEARHILDRSPLCGCGRTDRPTRWLDHNNSLSLSGKGTLAGTKPTPLQVAASP